MGNMKTMRRWQGWSVAGLGLLVAALTGCQTWTSGMTLPSGHYLQHPPQYFQPSPPFPLTRELATMEGAGPPGLPPGVGAPLPAAVPPGGAFGPGPAGGAAFPPGPPP
jgi:hypothetical protein